MNNKKKQKELLEKLSIISSFTIVPIFIIATTLLIIFYAKGYRFSLKETIIVDKTGVLSIESSPSRADLYVDGIHKGETSKTVGSLSEGVYNVRLDLKEYLRWEKNLPVRAEKSTPYFAYLFRKEPIYSREYSTENVNIEDYLFSQDENNLFFTVTEKSDQVDSPGNTTVNYKVYKYKINRNFWDFNSNPVLIYEKTLAQNQNLEILPSPNGGYVLGQITKTVSDDLGDKTNTLSELILINANSTNNNEQITEINEYFNKYSIEWAKDNENLLLISKKTESITEEEIFSYNLTTESIYTMIIENTLPDKENNIWRTDINGNFYYLKYISEEDEINTSGKPFYQIIQKPLSGNQEQPVIKAIYYRENRDALDKILTEQILKEENTKEQYEKKRYLISSFSNSPDCAICVGKIESFEIQEQEGGVLLESTEALYWYDLETKRYDLVSATPTAKFLHFSPDQNNLAFVDLCPAEEKMNNCLKVFTFDKKESDHITQLGTGTVINKLENELTIKPSDIDIETFRNRIKWMNNSTYLYIYSIDAIENGKNRMNIKYIDIDGENYYSLAVIELENYLGKKLLTVDPRLENLYFISEYSSNKIEKETIEDTVTEEDSYSPPENNLAIESFEIH